jgi:prepilin-type N-terminal cleavage/methylation domain-containing protein
MQLHHKGFSLAELLLVIVIITGMTMMGTSVWNRYITNTNFREAARGIEADMKFMKQNALARAYTTDAIPNVTYSIFFDRTNRLYTLQAIDSATLNAVFTKTRQLSSFGRGSIAFFSLPGGGDTFTLTFLQRGILSGPPPTGSVIITNSRNDRASITYSQSGKIYAEFTTMQ